MKYLLLLSLLLIGCSEPEKIITKKDYTAEKYIKIKNNCVDVATASGFDPSAADIHFDHTYQYLDNTKGTYVCHIPRTLGRIPLFFDERELATVKKFLSTRRVMKNRNN